MKTNAINIITAAVLTGLIVGFGSTTVTGDMFAGLTVAVSIWAAFALIAMIAADYRTGPKAYFASKLATGHFRTASVAIRAESVKSTRMAA